MANPFHEDAVSAVQRCEEIDKRMMIAIRETNDASNTVVAWALVWTFIACMLSVASISANDHYALQDKINQENISWQNR